MVYYYDIIGSDNLCLCVVYRVGNMIASITITTCAATSSSTTATNSSAGRSCICKVCYHSLVSKNVAVNIAASASTLSIVAVLFLDILVYMLQNWMVYLYWVALNAN